MTEIRHIDSIVVEDRHRKDLGDIDALAESIKRVGLIHPVAITPDGQLIAGHRRLAAHRRLGRTGIPVRVVDTLTSAIDMLVAERDENTCRMDMRPSELVALGMALEELERPKAVERQGQRTDLQHPDPGSRKSEPTGLVRDIVGKALGVSGGTYARMKTVVAAAENEPDPEVRAIAQEALQEMDATGVVKPATEKLRHARHRKAVEAPDKVAVARDLAASGHSTSQIAVRLGYSRDGMAEFLKRHGVEVPADAILGRTRNLDSQRIVRATVEAVDGIGILHRQIDFTALNLEDVAGWLAVLDAAIRSLTTLRANLRKASQP